MRIEVQVPLGTDPMKFDKLLEDATPDGFVIQRRSGLPVDYTQTIVVGLKDPDGTYPAPSHIALSAQMYELREGETS